MFQFAKMALKMSIFLLSGSLATSLRAENAVFTENFEENFKATLSDSCASLEEATKCAADLFRKLNICYEQCSDQGRSPKILFFFLKKLRKIPIFYKV